MMDNADFILDSRENLDNSGQPGESSLCASIGSIGEYPFFFQSPFQLKGSPVTQPAACFSQDRTPKAPYYQDA
jgi:hypothetical protein